MGRIADRRSPIRSCAISRRTDVLWDEDRRIDPLGEQPVFERR